MQKMGFTKVGNVWIFCGAHDHELAQVEQIKRKSKNPLLDQWTLSPITLKKTEPCILTV